MLEYLREARSLGITNPWDLIQSLKNFAVTTWEPWDSDISQGINLLLKGDLKRMSPEQVIRYEERNPVQRDLFREGYDPEIDPKKLSKLPEGTLGKEYSKLIFADDLDPLGTLLAFGKPRNTVHYAMRRAYKLHDVLHVVLGCDTTVLGEVRIVSFSLGQTVSAKRGATAGDAGSLSAGMALAVLFLHLTIRRPLKELAEAVRLAAEWMALGERTETYFDFKLEEMMEMPVEEVRKIVLGGSVSVH